MKHYGDICALRGANLEPVDCIIGGSPCQGLSQAGKRKGLNDERSGLFMEQIRIIKEMREEDIRRGRAGQSVRPRIAVWENVPGAFSTGKPKGEDFRVVLEEFARIADPAAHVPRPPKRKWRTAGAILGDGWSLAWRVMDAQFFGVPQRRRRIALVCDFGSESAHEVLFEREVMPGDAAPGREAGRGTAENPGAGAGVADRMDGRDGATWPAVANTLTRRHDSSPMPGQLQQIRVTAFTQNQRDEVRDLGDCAGALAAEPGAKQQTYVALAIPINTQIAMRSKALGEGTGLGVGADGDPAFTLQANHSHGVMTAGFNGHRAAGAGIEFAGERAPTVGASMPPNVVAGFKAGQGDKAGGIGYQDETAPTIGGTASGLNQVPAVMCLAGDTSNAAFDYELCGTLKSSHEQPIAVDCRNVRISGINGALQSAGHGGSQNNNAIIIDCRHDRLEDISGTLVAKGSGDHGVQDNNPVMQYSIVRRLTPLECERLQGYPVGWTDIPEITDISDEGYELFKQLLFDAAVRNGTARENPATGTWEIWSKKRYEVRRGGKAQYIAVIWKNTGRPYRHKGREQMIAYINALCSDSARYQALGNSIALPPWQWTCQQIHDRHGVPLTMGSLFDGIGGFPLIWERINGKGTALWASEIEPFCVAVTRYHFGSEEEAMAA